MNLGLLIDNAFMRHRSRIAAFDDTRSYTFEALDERSRRLGNWLRACGIDCGDGVASLQHNSIETIEIELAASRFGLVRSFLNAKGTVHEHAQALRLAQAKALIHSSEFRSAADELRRNVPSIEVVLCIDADGSADSEYEAALAASSTRAPECDVSESAGHSIYFTSGTTGTPKGILLSHRTWLALVRNHLVDTYASTGPDDVVLHAAPMSHASGALILTHLVRGAAQRVLRRFEVGAVLEAFERDRISNIWLAPTMLIMLMEDPSLARRDLGSLRSVRYGGAPMARERVREAVRRLGPVVCSGWGQWEAPQQCTYLSQSQIVEALGAGQDHRLASVGRPVTFGKVAVANENGELLPADTEGEVVVAGDHLMVGYLGQPEQTAALRFGPWQRTGDIGKIDRDGFVYLTDRKNDLIITGGSNVYPRDVEEALYAHPAVREAVAIGIPDERWGETVRALVVLRSGCTVSSDELMQWCKQHLASYKRPRSVEFVDDLPKNAYGKILRRAIRQRYWSQV